MSLPVPVATHEASAPLVYDGDHLVVRHEEGGSDWTLVTFNESSMVAAGGLYWGQTFVRRNGLSAFGFVTKTPNWFPAVATLRAIASIAPRLTEGSPRVLYGHSMGGYAAIKFSAALKAHTVIAFSPQFSIEPRHTGKFSLYAGYHSEANSGMRIETADIGGRVFVFYDPCLDHDRFHAGEIVKLSAVILIPVRHTGHDTIRCFSSGAVGLRLMETCRSDDRPALLRLVASRRRLFSARYRNVALAVAKRRPALAMAIMAATAESLGREDFANIYAAAGEGYFKTGRLPQAEHCIAAATEISPKNAMHSLLRSAFLMHTKRVPESLVWAERALALAPDNAFARQRLTEIETILARPARIELAR